jgi:hypothetical protein
MLPLREAQEGPLPLRGSRARELKTKMLPFQAGGGSTRATARENKNNPKNEGRARGRRARGKLRCLFKREHSFNYLKKKIRIKVTFI